MELSNEFWIQIVIYAGSFGICVGLVKATLKSLKSDITRLEKKQDKHNNFMERLAVLETKYDTANPQNKSR